MLVKTFSNGTITALCNVLLFTIIYQQYFITTEACTANPFVNFRLHSLRLLGLPEILVLSLYWSNNILASYLKTWHELT